MLTESSMEPVSMGVMIPGRLAIVLAIPYLGTRTQASTQPVVRASVGHVPAEGRRLAVPGTLASTHRAAL